MQADTAHENEKLQEMSATTPLVVTVNRDPQPGTSKHTTVRRAVKLKPKVEAADDIHIVNSPAELK